MATEDGFQPGRSLILLPAHAEEAELLDIARAWDIATIASRILQASIVAATVTAIGIAVLTIGNPDTLVANVTDWWVDKPALQPDADPPTPTVQSIASTQNLPQTAMDAPPRVEIAVAAEPADQSRAEVGQSQAYVGQPLTEALFKQFQTWATEEETRAKVEPAQPVLAAPVKMEQECPSAGPAREKAATGPVHAKCTRRDPASAKSRAKSGRARCTGTGPARSCPPGTGPVRAKCPDTVAPAKSGFAQLGQVSHRQQRLSR